MTKFVGLLGRKAFSDSLSHSSAATETRVPSPAPVDLDEDLFSTLGAQMGGDNEVLRNLLIDASYKIGELDEIKACVTKLIDPVGKTLRAFEIEKADKLALQSTLTALRTDHGTLREEHSRLEQQAGQTARDAARLREELATATRAATTLEAARDKIADQITGLKVQATDLETRLHAETTESRRLREDGRRFEERIVIADRRNVQLESELGAVRQKFTMLETEKRTIQTALEKAIQDAARAARHAVEVENQAAAMQSRLRQVEAQLGELSGERTRLMAALEDANERYEREQAAAKTRLDAMASRVATSEKLLIEARDQMTARADELRQHERQIGDLTLAHDTLRNKLTASETARGDADAKIHEIEQDRAVLHERNATLTRTVNSRDLALNRADERITALNDMITALQNQLDGARLAQAREIEDLKAALNREKVERSVAEGALEAGRKDLARVMREVMALQRRQTAQEPGPTLVSANAA
ncbi:MAG: hypothetical protein J0H78_02795 [Rhizobiales bacterium]|nr:hypothetical protein [Hyphomicrobiales bacterium]OJY43074.1 MAG: hypothetical protein BGP08_20605 [Rhizobiales bacterium 64-17]